MRFLDLFNEIEKGSYALTDEAVYYSIKNNDEMIPLWGGNKSHNKVDRMVSKSAKTKDGQDIKIFSGEGIIISLDGSAGSMTLILSILLDTFFSNTLWFLRWYIMGWSVA